MSLIDLKKGNGSKKKKKVFTIDEFIADAENYAQGAPQIVGGDAKNKLSLKQAILEAKRLFEIKEAQKKDDSDHYNGPFRRATFTLSEDAISQLKELSVGTDLAKSHIIRILIDELCNKEQHEQLKKLLESKIG